MSTQDDPKTLPTVIASSVIRFSQKGDTHGGLYLADLETGDVEEVMDWADCDIDWSGRGGARGLRGIDFYDGNVVVAASDEIMIYDRDFKRLDSFRNDYLRGAHEIHVHGDTLYITSTPFDSVLGMNLKTGEFDYGVCLRQYETGFPVMKPWEFDPSGSKGPTRADEFHVNMVYKIEDTLFVAGSGFKALVALYGERPMNYTQLPMGTHNARPFRGGVIYNFTRHSRTVVMDNHRHKFAEFDAYEFPEDSLVNTDFPREKARQGWLRGLAVWDDLIITGTSPGAVVVNDLQTGEVTKMIQFTNDVLCAIHGLEIWPY